MIAPGCEAPRWCLMAMALGLSVGTTATAFAHAPPQATDIRWIGERAVIRTNRGLVVEDEPGASFRLLCNDAYQASLTDVVPLELTLDGRVLLATYGGGIVLSTPDHCSFEAAAGPFDEFIALDVAGDAQGRFHAVAYPLDDSTPALFQSDDDGRSFHHQTDLSGVPTSVRVAPSDPTRVYVSISVPDGNAVAARLGTSTDAGRVFRETPIALEPSELGVLVLGVHPRDPNRAFVRTQSRNGVSPERLLVRNAETEGFETALSAPGPLSMAWGADGIIWAASAQGLHRFIEDDERFAPATSFDVSRLGCVATRANRLYVCGYSAGEFGVLVSDDEAASFEWFLRFPAVKARLDCPASSHEGTSCESAFLDWSIEQGLVSPEGGAAGEPPPLAGAGGGTSGSSASRPPAADRGCALTRTGPAHGAQFLTTALVAWFAVLARRRRQRSA
jgi:hypothetical protein